MVDYFKPKQAQLLLDLPLKPNDHELVTAYVSLLDMPFTKRLATLKGTVLEKSHLSHLYFS